MNSLFTKIRDKHALWYKGIIFIVCVVLCVYVLPKKTSVEATQVKIGDVWLNDNLISPFDFLIKKSNSELIKERKEKRKQIAYFTKTKVQTENYISNFKEIPASKLPVLKSCLDSIFNVGYYTSDINKNYQDTIFYVVVNNEVRLTKKEKLFDKEKIKIFLASKQIDEDISNHVLEKIKPNIIYDDALSAEMSQEDDEASYIYKSKIQEGEIILHKNDIITEEKSNILNSYNQELQDQETKTPLMGIILGQLLACILILGIMMLFLAFFRKSIFSQNTHVTFIFLIIMLIILITSIVAKYNVNYIYAIPFCLVPILIRVFFDSRTSLFNFLNIILLCAFFMPDKFEFVFIQLIKCLFVFE